MKQRHLFLFCFFVFNFSFAQNKVISASEICVKAASDWALKSEAKQTKTNIKKIKDVENKSLGGGTMLYLTSVFVEGPNTGDNTHWEIVGEYKIETASCKVLLGRRHWQHF